MKKNLIKLLFLIIVNILPAISAGNIDDNIELAFLDYPVRDKAEYLFYYLKGLSIDFAICQNDDESLMLVEELLKLGADINEQDCEGDMSLHYAINKSRWDIVQRLLKEENLDIDKQNVYGITALHLAALKGNAPLVKSLLNKGANAYLTTIKYPAVLPAYSNKKPIDFASTIEAFELLSVQGDGFEVSEELHKAIKEDDLYKVQSLLSQGSNINALSSKKRGAKPPLCTAIMMYNKNKPNNKDIIKLLINSGANVNALSKQKGNSHLHLAIIYSAGIEMLQMLLDNYAHINKKNFDNNTPLHLAAQHGQKNIVKFLLEKGADCNIRNKYNHVASQSAINKEVHKLIKSYIANNVTDHDKASTSSSSARLISKK